MDLHHKERSVSIQSLPRVPVVNSLISPRLPWHWVALGGPIRQLLIRLAK